MLTGDKHGSVQGVVKQAPLSITALVLLAGALQAVAQSMSPVQTRIGPPVPASAAGLPPDSTQGECTSEVLTTFVRPSNTLKAVFYFPWHHDPAVNTYWPACVVPQKNGLVPQAGFYSSTNNAVIAAHMATMAANGVNVVGVEWTGRDTYEDENTLRSGGVLDAAKNAGLQVALLYDLTIAHGGIYDVVLRGEDIKINFRYLRDNYFKKNGEPRTEYLRINNKPVVYIYASRALESSDTNNLFRIQALFNEIRAEVGDLYIVADHLWYTGENMEKLRQIGAQAVSAFHAADGQTTGSMSALTSRFVTEYYDRNRKGILALNDVNISPGVFPQYDDRGTQAPGCGLAFRTPQNYPLASASEWQTMLKSVGTEQRWNVKKVQIRNDCSENVIVDRSSEPSIMWVYSFNEWAEGAGIEPVQSVSGAGRYPWNFGSDLINTLRDHSFSAGSGSADAMIPYNRGPQGPQEKRRPNFAWDGVLNATDYELQVIRQDNAVVVATQTQTSTIFVPPFDFDPGLAFRTRVRAKVGGAWQAWSEETVFTTEADVPETGTHEA